MERVTSKDGTAIAFERIGTGPALVPVGGWGPTLGPGHLDADRAARALAMARPGLAVPIHLGTYAPVGVPRGAGPHSSRFS